MNDEAWFLVWGKLAPMLSTPGLEALHKALMEDDQRLLQGATTQPPPLMCVQEWECEGACFIGFAGWQGDGLKTVGEVEEYFSQICSCLDAACGEEAACRYFLNWFDCDDPNRPGLTRERVRAELAPLVAAELDTRKVVAT